MSADIQLHPVNVYMGLSTTLPEHPLVDAGALLRNTQLGLTRGFQAAFTSCMLKIPPAILQLLLSAGMICLLIHTTFLFSGAMAGPGPNSAN